VTFEAFNMSSRVVITLVAHQLASTSPDGEDGGREALREEGAEE